MRCEVEWTLKKPETPASAAADVMPKHTPGPWEVADDNRDTVRVHRVGPIPKGKRYSIASLGVGRGDKEDKANAQLIAAAPNLLSAAKRMLEAVHSKDPAEPGTQRPDGGAVMSLKGAIAKAEGEV